MGMTSIPVDTKFENGLYYFSYAGRRRILTNAAVQAFAEERKGQDGLKISEELLYLQMTEIELDLSCLN